MNFDMSWFSMPVFWLAAAIILLVIEGLTMGLTTIWFAGGSIIALLAALLGANLGVQLVIFFGVSVVFLLSTRKLFIKKLQTGREKTNVDALIGCEAVVLSEIRPFVTGLIKLNGQEWSASAGDGDTVIPAGTKVKVKGIEGVKAIVVPSEE